MAAVVPDPPEQGTHVLCSREGSLEWQPIEVLRGPRGFPGERGERGPSGPAGRPGKDAPTIQINIPRQTVEEPSTEGGGGYIHGWQDGSEAEWQ